MVYTPIPYSIPIESDLEMWNTVHWAMSEPSERSLAIADAIVPPVYELYTLHVDHSRVWCRFNALSGKTRSWDYDSKIFNFYVRLFERGHKLEKAGDIDRALDFYILTVFGCCPTGTLYYERPAILLEKKKLFLPALMICDLALRGYYMSHTVLLPEFKKRRERLLRRLGDVDPETANSYPIIQPPYPRPWKYDSGIDLEKFKERLINWSNGITEDAELDEDYRKWLIENAEEFRIRYDTK